MTLIINGAFQIIMYTALFAATTLLDTTKATATNYGHVFNVANVVSMANRYLPIPGAEGITQ
ncbi:hypothetical protein FACS1894166_00210 [Bacilli bacterium]|nr:hypothetical protein FACS1894166_00210 [Bacilli bacterium]